MITMIVFDLFPWTLVMFYHFFEWKTIDLSCKEKICSNLTTHEEIEKELHEEDLDYRETYLLSGQLDASYLIRAYEEKYGVYRKEVEISTIEGSGAESLLSSLQKDLNILDESPELDEDDPRSEETVEVQIQRKKDKLENLSQMEGVENLEEIVKTMHEIYQMEGRDDDMKWLENQYREYFEAETEQPAERSFEESDLPPFFEEDCIQIDQTPEQYFEIPEDLSKLSTSSIKDSLNAKGSGEEVWVGKVIGMSANYIHFSDGTDRTWLDCKRVISKIKQNDLLIVKVFIYEDKKIVKEMIRVNSDQTVGMSIVC